MELLLNVFLSMLLIVGILFLGVIIYAFVITPFKKRKAKKQLKELDEELKVTFGELSESFDNIINEAIEELKKESEKKEKPKRTTTKNTKNNVKQ